MVPSFLSSFIGTTSTYLVAFFFLGYLIPHVFVALFYKTKNLKKSYHASWGLVTGGSSGESTSSLGWLAGWLAGWQLHCQQRSHVLIHTYANVQVLESLLQNDLRSKV